MAAVVTVAGIYAYAPRQLPPLQPTHIPVDKAQLDAIVQTDAGLVVAGGLGQILVSTDGGKNWTSATLSNQRNALITRLVFIDGKTGLALGHEGWILKTTDGGLTWNETAFDEENGEPYMSAAKLPSGNWIAIGAFGRAVQSTDQGQTWQPYTIPDTEDTHMNAIASSDDAKNWLLVGEAGLIMTSHDSGQTWQHEEPFYQGSFYGAAFLGGTNWVIYGMRSSAYYSSDNGTTWTQSKMPGKISIHGHAVTKDGSLFLVGQGGIVMASTDKGHEFHIVHKGGDETLTGILPQADGHWLLSSNHGLRTFTPATGVASGS